MKISKPIPPSAIAELQEASKIACLDAMVKSISGLIVLQYERGTLVLIEDDIVAVTLMELETIEPAMPHWRNFIARNDLVEAALEEFKANWDVEATPYGDWRLTARG